MLKDYLYYQDNWIAIYQGDCREILKELPEKSIHCCVTSPPYWGLRDYKTEPLVWGGDGDCGHQWGNETFRITGNAPSATKSTLTTNAGKGPQLGNKYSADNIYKSSEGQFCQLCNAWRGSLGLEPTPELYCQHLVEIFREVKRVLRDDGTVWLNLGDSYATHNSGGKGYSHNFRKPEIAEREGISQVKPSAKSMRLKEKDLVGIPWMIAFALRNDGWYLRSDIIWSKPNPMPESVTDRPTTAHEHIFLLAKSGKTLLWRHSKTKEWVYQKPEPDYVYETVESEWDKTPDGWDTGEGTHGTIHRHGREKGKKYKKTKRKNLWKGFDYYYDADAIKENFADERMGNPGTYKWSYAEQGIYGKGPTSLAKEDNIVRGWNIEGIHKGRNKRSVWTIATQPFPEAHFAVFPEKLIEPCMLAGCPKDGIVLDPFLGSGTTAIVALKYNRSCIGIELNPEYVKMANSRIEKECPQLNLRLV